ncbi:MAG: hypothetical protein AAGK32_20725 [Actinomycetota bacterium]
MGLNISHRIITEKHDGSITVASRPGSTTFTVRLPITDPNDRAEATAGAHDEVAR